MITFIVTKVQEYADYVLCQLVNAIPKDERDFISPGENLSGAMGGSLFCDQSTLILQEKPDAARLKEIATASDYSDIIITCQAATPTMRKLSQTHDVTFIEFTSKKAYENVQAFLNFIPLHLSPQAKNIIVNHVGESAHLAALIVSELEQIPREEGEVVGEDEVRYYLGTPGLKAVWALTDTIDTGNTPQSLEVLDNLLQENSPHALISILISHYTKMFYFYLLGKPDPTAEEGARLPYPAIKAQKAMRHYGANVLACYELTHDASAEMKGIKRIPANLVLEILVGRLSAMARA